MFCPQCRAEYRSGFTVCSDCNVALVDELPPEDPHPDFDLETVYVSTNPALIGIVKTVLESAGIDFMTSGEEAASVVFPGNPYIGQVQILVPDNRAEEARELLSEIEESEEPLTS